jgi:23S rRNA (cytosine1962-C5)-methyltransferase
MSSPESDDRGGPLRPDRGSDSRGGGRGGGGGGGGGHWGARSDRRGFRGRGGNRGEERAPGGSGGGRERGGDWPAPFDPRQERGGDPRQERGGDPRQERGGDPRQERGGDPRQERGADPRRDGGGPIQDGGAEEDPEERELESAPEGLGHGGSRPGQASADVRSVQLDSDEEVTGGPWIFARQVRDFLTRPLDGALVEVLDASGRFVGHALWNPGSDIRLRFLSRGRKNDLDRPREFLLRRIKLADDLRRKVLRLDQDHDTYRVVHAEGDDLSGLVIDRLGDALVCEYHSLGFYRLREDIEAALNTLYPGFEVAHRVPANAARSEDFQPDEEPELAERILHENGLAYPVAPAFGHKTGWFCDQRDNRRRIAELAAGRDVLDLCCNQGGFALHAKKQGARRVRGVDIDEVVLERAEESARRNGLEIQFQHADAFPFLRNERARPESERPQVVVVDPHKLIGSRAGMEDGLKKYHDLNALALECVRPGGLLASFSCSGLLPESAFIGMLFQSARRAQRSVRLIQQLGAAPDHPQRPDFARSRYLKGALLYVE